MTRDAALAMLDDLRGSPHPGRRARAARPSIGPAVADLIVAVARLGAERRDIVEVDLNPVIATAAGAVAVDALVVLEGSDA